MIVARLEKLGIQWGIDNEERMNLAADDGALILDIKDNTETILFDGSQWLTPKPSFVPNEKTICLVKKEYVDERLRLLLRLIEESFSPALSLIPQRYRSGINETFEELKELISDGTQ